MKKKKKKKKKKKVIMKQQKKGLWAPPVATVFPRFSGEASFARLPTPSFVQSFDIAVIGAPFDSGCSYRPGTRFGPRYVRTSSALLRPYNPYLHVRPFHDLQIVDAGDAGLNPFKISEALTKMEEFASEMLSRSRLNRILTIGGDHTISLPLLRAMKKKHGPVALIHFDAHLDTWDTYFGEPYTHGTPFRRAWEEELLLEDHSIHVGTRGPIYSETDIADDKSFGFKVIRAEEFETEKVPAIAQRIIDRVGDAPVYLSIDIDVLDPAFAPGTGTPEPGGLTSRELICLLRALAVSPINLVSADVMEVAPAYDHAELTCLAASTICYEILSWFAVQAKRAKSK
eukprot:CAMPEP_0201489770 /NCGR_PEP_ID=MMETSP0151_2-20130828/23618_1 /ASSEMBLY_ACC=CAM_ASM_000257 /TAXON_ID=200890 /ORGANISM="Paramoeba atlantica, Strain 621/1 / CCAP 1560/9" /LENGTH=341 /DNA_ID=CAMNT_0047875461 /DNA_START=132 /DNA_END=1156 /DNA_ORIENTATION=-